MAIIKTTETPHGVPATYHRVLGVTAHEGATQVTVAIYATPEARVAGKHPLWHEHIDLPLDLRPLIYSALAEHGPLTGGVADTAPEGTQ
ncbi:hypothetical protein [Rhizobacter sp. Root1221]|uniref:hypothetical protein n=1 Tax=Rhizobacter sp. Root1221 TaxID=1736433 RepID=UPI0006FCA605|nr:hypothetical protein [Rhizobacter sp. Root1221]KQV99961.1 hypothetical protein ASC87_19870 [Rhizobacter sp. Root1221]